MDGLYKVEYKINDGSGRSVMYAHDGVMLGGNTAFAHLGRFHIAGGEVIAEILTERHSPSTVFRSLIGRDDVMIRMRGTPEGEAVRFVGEIEDEPDATFRCLMTPLRDDDMPPPGQVGEGGITSGLYAVEIKMLDGIGGGNTGVMLLHDGRLFGGDAFFYYLGAYSSANGRWKGEFVNQEHTPTRGERPLFGGYEVGIGFSGRHDATSAEAEATALAGKRSVRFAARLRLIRPFSDSAASGDRSRMLHED